MKANVVPSYLNSGLVEPYAGDGRCNRHSCREPARWSPVFIFVALSFPENEDTRILIGFTKFGVCDRHQADAAVNLRQNSVNPLRDELNKYLRSQQKVTCRFARMEWRDVGGVA